MSNIQKGKAQDITLLYNEIAGHLRQSLEKAIRIGELLVEQKKSLKHGEFTPWIEGNLPFTDRTARNYMRLFNERDSIKTETVSDLTSAYRLLAEPKPLEWPESFEHCLASSVNILREELGNWPAAFKVVSLEYSMPIPALLKLHRTWFGDITGIEPEASTEEELKQFAGEWADKLERLFEERLNARR